MPEPMTCFACEQEPTQQCPRCGRPYCDDHGEELCDVCMQPASGVPSFTLYRGSLLALLVGVVVAVWLLVQPPGSTTDAALGPTVITPSAEATNGTNNQSTPASMAATAATTPQTSTTGTPRATNTTAPGTTRTPTSGNQYTVQSGDTLGGICASQRPNVEDCVARLRTLNNLSGDNISIGQVLTLP